MAEVETGGYALLVVLQKPEVGRMQNYDPVSVPMNVVSPDMGPCVSLSVAYVTPEDEEKLTALANIGAGEEIARFVSTGSGDYEDAKTKIVYRRVTSKIQ